MPHPVMEPEKATLRQTGLSIKNSWQQFMSVWVQPELDTNERLFALNSGKSGVFGFEEMPFQKSMDELLNFSEKLCFVGWPFELDATVQQSQPENGPETNSGRRKSFLSQQKRATGRPVEEGLTEGSFPPEPNGEVFKPGEKGNPAIETRGNSEERLEPGRNPGTDQQVENEKAVSGPQVKTNNPSPQTGSGMKGKADPESFPGNDFDGPGGISEPGEREQNVYQGPGKFAANAMKNTDWQESSSRSTSIQNSEHSSPETPNYSNKKEFSEPVFGYPEPSEIKSNLPFQPVYEQYAADTELISEEPSQLPTVKTLKSLGSWLQQNAIGELSRTEIIENKPPSAISDFNAGNNREDNHPSISETNPEEYNPIEFSHFNEHYDAPQNSPKPVSEIFENIFPFPGEISNTPDSDDLIRELTEQLNREFKRFYGP